MAVYDDVRGWDTLPYLGQEFYLEYGNFDYAVTVPADMIVAGSGQLMNPAEVLTPDAAARASPRPGQRQDGDDPHRRTRSPATPPATPGRTKTWRFHMDHTRDVSFAASPRLRLGRRAGQPAGRQDGAGPVGLSGRERRRRRLGPLDRIPEVRRRGLLAPLVPYPWPNAINVGGPVGGMEYPASLFDSMNDKGKNLFYLTVHEIGHTYFPMVVGTDERR